MTTGAAARSLTAAGSRHLGVALSKAAKLSCQGLAGLDDVTAAVVGHAMHLGLERPEISQNFVFEIGRNIVGDEDGLGRR